MVQPLPRIFGGYARNRILYALAIRGPQGRRELGRTAEVDPQQTLELVRTFAQLGVVTHHPGERKLIELNARFCAAAELRRLIYAIAREPNHESTTTRAPIAPPANILELFGSCSRGHVLMALANPARSTTTAAVMASTSLTEQSVSAAVKYLERDAIVTAVVEHHTRTIRLNREFAAASELFDFVSKLHVEMNAVQSVQAEGLLSIASTCPTS